MKGRIAAAVVGLTATLGMSVAPAATQLSASSQARVADLRTAEFRVVVTATKDGSGSAPTAKVAVATFHRSGGGRWLRTGRHLLRGSYFWHTLSGSRAICRLELRAGAARAKERPRVTVQLLMTPSLGCARAYDFLLASG